MRMQRLEDTIHTLEELRVEWGRHRNGKLKYDLPQTRIEVCGGSPKRP